MNHRPYPSPQRALHIWSRRQAARPAVPAFAALGISAGQALANAADAARGLKNLSLSVSQIFAATSSAGRAALERAVNLEDYYLAAAAWGIPRWRAKEILTAVQGPCVGAIPTDDDIAEARRQVTFEATSGTGFRYTGAAHLDTDTGPVPLAEVYLYEDAARYYGPGLDGVEHLLADRHSWSGTAIAASQYGGCLLLHTDGPLTLLLADGREAQVKVHNVRPDPPAGAFRIALNGIGRPPLG